MLYVARITQVVPRFLLVTAVALVLALPTELDYWYVAQSMVFGVVLFSLLVQGTTNSALIARFGKSPTEG